jgi:DNA-binding NarL/FixJ family response regulator
MTSDAPHELILSGVYSQANIQQAGEAIVASEYLEQDFNAFASLASRRVPVGILSVATRARPERSRRYRELLEPSGIPFELRAAFVIRGRAWGALHMARRAGNPDFGQRDADAIAGVATTIAEGIRTSLRFDAARRVDDPGAPGLLILSGADEVELITPPARGMLAALQSTAAAGEERPATSVLALAASARTRANERGPHADVIAVPSREGWITLHASLPDPGDSRVAVVLERTSSAQTRSMHLEAHGVTRRESEIAGLLAKGLSNADIASTLVLSPYTVQDHIKALYEKTGVSSRQELIARVFLDDYLPLLATGSDVTSTGTLSRPGNAR